MDYFIVFVKDISGFWYILYILACFFFIFLLLGIVGDRKRAVIAERLKMKKAFDIASGREAKIAAMETKQVLDVFSNPVANSDGSVSNADGSISQDNLEQGVEKAPSVLTIDANGNSPIPVERTAVSNPNLDASSSSLSVPPVQNTNENPVSTQNIQS